MKYDKPSKEDLILLLKEHNGNMSAAAGSMGLLGTSTLWRWCREYGITQSEYRTVQPEAQKSLVAVKAIALLNACDGDMARAIKALKVVSELDKL